jgi:hemerythrin-like domain-containing protein
VREAFASHLEPHFGIEEQHLLPALEAIGESELARRIRDDHAALRELLGASPADPATLARFGERLEAHIRSEEREVFEVTQHRLPADALEAIAAACRATPRACSVSFDD